MSATKAWGMAVQSDGSMVGIRLYDGILCNKAGAVLRLGNAVHNK